MTLHTASGENRKSRKFSIRLLMTFPFVLQIVAAVWIIGYLSFQNEQRSANDFSIKLRSNAIGSLRQEINEYLRSPMQAIKLNIQARKTDPIDTQTSSEIVQQFIRLTNVFSSITDINIGDEHGNYLGIFRQPNQKIILKSTDKFPKRNWYQYNSNGDLGSLFKNDLDYDPRASNWYQKAITKKDLVWTDIYLLEDEFELGISATQALFDNEGNLKHAIAASLNLSKINDLLEKTQVSSSSQIFIVEPSGLLVATSTKTPLTIKKDGNIQRLKASDSDNAVIREAIITTNKRFGKVDNIQNIDQLEIDIPKKNSSQLEPEKHIIGIYPYRDTAGLDWYIFVALPKSDILSKYDNELISLVWLCIGIGGIFIVLGIQTANLIVKPIFELRDASLAITSESFSQPIPSYRIVELSILSESLEKMRLQVSQSHEQLQEYSRSLEHKVEERTSELEKEIDDRIAIQAELQEKAVVVSQHYQVLNDLAKDESMHQGNISICIQRLTEAVARTIKVERSSVWLVQEDRIHWTCLDLFLLSTEEHIIEPNFLSNSLPSYLGKLKAELAISVNDALSDPQTSDLTDGYLIQLGITSTLQIPLRQNSDVVGILSLEHTGDPRNWSLLDQSFARSIGDLIALAIESYNRNLAEKQLKESEERWQLALEGNNDGIWDWNCKTNEAFYSPRYQTMLGYGEKELVGHPNTWRGLIHPEDAGLAIQATNNYLEKKIPNYIVEYRLRCKDGSYKWILARAKALFDESGVPVRMIGSHTDITDRHKYEEELRKRASTLSLHNQVLAKLAGDEKLRMSDLKSNIRLITETVVRTLNVERVSIWMAKQNDTCWNALTYLLWVPINIRSCPIWRSLIIPNT